MPDANYSQWVIRLDLHDVAMFGTARTETVTETDDANSGVQADRVVVTRRRKTSKGTA